MALPPRQCHHQLFFPSLSTLRPILFFSTLEKSYGKRISTNDKQGKYTVTEAGKKKRYLKNCSCTTNRSALEKKRLICLFITPWLTFTQKKNSFNNIVWLFSTNLIFVVVVETIFDTWIKYCIFHGLIKFFVESTTLICI